jgi:hypothetical protein
VIPQLREVAAWISFKRPSLLAAIVANDPQVLLRSMLMNLDPEVRASTTHSLLALAAERKIADYISGSRQRYAVLRHPGLSGQLRPYLTADGQEFMARRMALEIAVACDCRELAGELVNIALNTRETYAIRTMAAHAVVRIAPQEQKERLRPLLETSQEEDPDDELRGYALQALWPVSLSARDLFERHVRDPRNPDLLGSYSSFLWSFPEQLTPEDLPAALEWVSRQPSDHQQSMSLADLAPAIMSAAWAHINDSNVLPAFARAAAHRLHQYDDVLGEREAERRGDSAIKNDRPGRRRLVEALTQASDSYSGDDRRQLAMRVAALLQPEDLLWLLEQHDAATQANHRAWWLDLMGWTFNDQELEHVEALIGAARLRADVRDHFRGILDPMDLASPRAASQRQRLLTRGGDTLARHETPVADRVASLLARIEAGEIDQWWQLNVMLARHEVHRGEVDEYEADLTRLPSWHTLDTTTRERIVKAAVRYIADGDPCNSEWLGTNTFHRPAAAGYRALRLLVKEQPSRLQEVSPDSWAKWAATILTYHEQRRIEDEGIALECVALAYRHAPGAIVRCVEFVIRDRSGNHSLDLVMWKLGAARDRRLARTILREAADPTLPGPSTALLLKHVLQWEEAETLSLALKIIRERRVSTQHMERATHVAVALLQEAPAKVWPEVWPVLRKARNFGRAVMNLFAADWYPASTPKLLTELSESSLADLYLWLRRNLPQGARVGRTVARSPEELYGLADAVLTSLKGRGTNEAVHELRRIADSLPDNTWMRFTVLDAEDLRIRGSWGGVAIADLQNLLESGEARLVEDERQLMGIVLDSLKCLEDRLQKETPAVYDLWNERPTTPKDERRLSDYLKRHLNGDIRRRGIIANREVELRSTDLPDIRVDAIRLREDQPIETLSVVLEVKACWNSGLMNDMRRQLRDRYMRNNSIRCGVYVVGWYLCPEWSERDGRKARVPEWTADEAQSFFKKQAAELSGEGLELGAYVLNLTLPSSLAHRPHTKPRVGLRRPRARRRQGRGK